MKIKEGSNSYWLLEALEKTVDGLSSLDVFSYSGQIKAFKGIPEVRKRKNIVLAIKRLKNRGIVEYERSQDGMVLLKLTQSGREFISQTAQSVWDGKYRIVIWDIPENKRVVRNLLRRRLKEWGFVSWQKSVWVSRRNVTSRLRSLIDELGMEKWVAVIESEDQTLRALFK